MNRRSAAYKKRVASVAKAREAKDKKQVALASETEVVASLSTQPAPPPKQRKSTLSLRKELLASGASASTTVTTCSKENLIIRKDIFMNFFDTITRVCSKCMAILELNVSTNSADSTLEVKCKQCGTVEFSSSPMTGDEPSMTENNVDLVAYALLEGSGYAGYSALTAALTLTPLARAAYYKTVDYIGDKELNKELGFGPLSEIKKKHHDMKDKKRMKSSEVTSKPKRRRVTADPAYRSGEY